MNASVKYILTKSLVFCVGLLIYQSVFAGGEINFNLTNNTTDTREFTTCSPNNVSCANEKTVTLSAGQELNPITQLEIPLDKHTPGSDQAQSQNNIYDGSRSIQRSIFAGESKVCTIDLKGETYWSNKGGVRIKNESIAVTNFTNQYNYKCMVDKQPKTFKSGTGDIVNISITINHGLSEMIHSPISIGIKSSDTRHRKNYKHWPFYDVTCNNGSTSTFRAIDTYSQNKCVNYTNGTHTYSVCRAKHEAPSQHQLDDKVGEPFCRYNHDLANYLAKINSIIESSSIRSVKGGDTYYNVTCKNGSVSTFMPTSPGTGYDYTNGKYTYSTPMTRYPELRAPNHKELNDLVGVPFCQEVMK